MYAIYIIDVITQLFKHEESHRSSPVNKGEMKLVYQKSHTEELQTILLTQVSPGLLLVHTTGILKCASFHKWKN